MPVATPHSSGLVILTELYQKLFYSYDLTKHCCVSFFRVEYTLCDFICFYFDRGHGRACLVLHLLL